MAEVTIPDLYRALLQDQPKGEIPGFLPKRRWVLSRESVRSLAAQSGYDPEDVDLGLGHPAVASPGFLLGLPYRVDEAVEGFALEPIEGDRG